MNAVLGSTVLDWTCFSPIHYPSVPAGIGVYVSNKERKMEENGQCVMHSMVCRFYRLAENCASTSGSEAPRMY